MNESNNNENSIVSNETENKKYILYHAANASCFIKCLLHKCIYHPYDMAVFVGHPGVLNSYGRSDKYHLCLSYPIFLGPFGNCNSEDKDKVLEKICSMFDNMFSENNISITNFDEIYIGSYYGEFAMYVNAKKIPHSIMEEGAGDWRPLIWHAYPVFNQVISDLNMTNLNNSLVKKRLGIFSAWPKEFRTDKDVNFEPYKEIYKLSDEDKLYFVNFFNLPNIKFNSQNNNILLLTQWFLKDNKRWSDVDMYAYILDFFINYSSKTKVFIKPHPADPKQKNYCSIPDVDIIPASIPSELMGLIPNIYFQKALTISSTSLATVGEFCESTQMIGNGFINIFNKIPLFYIVFVPLLQYLDCRNSYRFGIMNEEFELLSKMDNIKFKYDDIKWKFWEKCGNSAIIVDKLKWGVNRDSTTIDMHEIDDNTVCVFTNVDELIENARGDVKSIIKKSTIIKVETIDKHGNISAEDYIYIFCKNKKIINKLNYFQISRTLHYKEAILRAYTLNPSESKINKLELFANLL